MDTKYFEYFLEVCRSKSLSEAAGRLFISRQTLAEAMTRFEEALELKLLERSKSGVRPTAVGEELYGIIKLRSASWQGDIVRLRSKQNGVISLNFCTGNVILISGILQALWHFERMNPHIHLLPRDVSVEDCFNFLRLGKADIACTYLPPEDYLKTLGLSLQGLRVEPVEKLHPRLYVLMHRAHPLHGRKTIFTEELRGQVMLVRDNGARGYLQYIASRLDIVPRYYHVDTFTVIRSLLEENCGFIIFKEEGARQLLSENITAVPIEDYPFDLRQHLFYREDAPAYIFNLVQCILSVSGKA